MLKIKDIEKYIDDNTLDIIFKAREEIIEALESYLTRENLIMAHDNEKFYKIGFCDGIRTILRA